MFWTKPRVKKNKEESLVKISSIKKLVDFHEKYCFPWEGVFLLSKNKRYIVICYQIDENDGNINKDCNG